ncbi:hypothetical protein D3C78_1630030 [compost metagenome]
MPPAPGWFSTTTVWPSAADSAGPADRVIVSTPEPTPTGRMNLMGRSDCALPRAGVPNIAAPSAPSICRRLHPAR